MDVVICEMQIFSDAPELPYGAVACLKVVFTDVTSTLGFLMGKSRLAPVKTISLPSRDEVTTQHLQILDRFNTDTTVYYRPNS